MGGVAREGYLSERRSAWLYRRVAEREAAPAIAALFRMLADEADAQAEIWSARLATQNQPVPAFRPGMRERVVVGLLRWLSPRRLRPVLAAMKVRGLSVYRQPASMSTHATPRQAGEMEAHHRGYEGGNLRAAVFGANDGLVSNTSLMMGVAGAGVEPATLLMAGMAGLLAGALSMAAGEYVSMRSQREMYEYQIALERAEIAAYPEEEAEELALIYAARGMEIEAARSLARELLRDPEHALDVLTREELGLNPEDLGSPWGAAFFSFFSFTLGAIVPLLPFLLGLTPTLPYTLTFAALGLFGLGAAISLFTGRGALKGGMRMLLIGAGAGAITYGMGHVLGVGLL